eukprot:9476645-Pyramimonas_sp.AAC.1
MRHRCRLCPPGPGPKRKVHSDSGAFIPSWSFLVVSIRRQPSPLGMRVGPGASRGDSRGQPIAKYRSHCAARDACQS